MIRGRKTEEEVYNDFIRLVYNRGLIYSLNIFFIGKGQVGKSTGVFYISNRLKQIKLGISKYDAKWNEWDWKKFTCTDSTTFVDLWDEYDSEIISLEEVAETMYYLDWTNLMSRVFSSTSATQGMKKNTCFLITPYFSDLVKNAKGKVDYAGLFHSRNDENMTVKLIPKYSRTNFKTFLPELKPIKQITFKYSKRFLKEANKYTNWLKKYKADVRAKNKQLVRGFNPNKPISMKNMPLSVRKTMEM